MSGPFDIKVVAPIEIEGYPFPLQLVHDGAVIDSFNWDQLAVVFVVKMRSLLFNLDDVNSPHAQHFFGEQEIAQSFLLLRMNLHQDNVLRVVPGNDPAPEKLSIRGVIESAQEIVEARSSRCSILQSVDIYVGFRQRDLVRIKRRERLQLDEFGL